MGAAAFISTPQFSEYFPHLLSHSTFIEILETDCSIIYILQFGKQSKEINNIVQGHTPPRGQRRVPPKPPDLIVHRKALSGY